MKEKGMLLCLDQTQKNLDGEPVALKDLELFGAGRVKDAKLDFMYRPC